MTSALRSAPKSSAPAMRKQPDTITRSRTSVFTLLKADHAEVKKLHKQFESLAESKTAAKELSALAQRIIQALKEHAELEEAVFYPAAREVLAEDDLALVDHADVEHESAKALIAKIEAMGPNDPHFNASVCVLCEYVEHHVKEEEGELFAACREAGIDERALGQLVMSWKQERQVA